MGLNKSNGNMYSWVTSTWNPLGGKCLHGCQYCSTNKLMRYPGIKNKYTGPVRLIEKELQTNLGSGNFIFVCAQHDLFAKDVPLSIVDEVLQHCNKFDNTYLFQTKNPLQLNRHFDRFVFPSKTKICTTIETNRWMQGVMANCPTPLQRAEQMRVIYFDKYITIEPIMDFDLHELVQLILIANPLQVNIGANTSNIKLPEPPKEKILELITELEKFTTVKLKSNLKRLL